MPNQQTINQNFPEANLQSRDTPTTTEGKPKTLHPHPRLEGVKVTLSSPDHHFIPAHQVRLASTAPLNSLGHFQGPTKIPTNEEVLKWHDTLKECALSKKKLA